MNALTILANSTERLAAGDFTVRTGLAAEEGELGRLICGFDRMVRNLEDCDRERRRAYEALRTSELRYRRLFESAQDGILLVDAATGEIDDANPFVTRLLGYTREQLIGQKLWEAGPFKGVDGSKVPLRMLHREEYQRHDDVTINASDGRPISVEFVSNVYVVDGQKVIQCNLRDITKRKRAEETRNECSRRMRVLSRRLVEAQETERRRLAREMHDEIGQALTVAQLNLQTTLVDLREPSKARLKESLDAVERVLEQVRNIALNLRPSMLDDLGLEAALRWYVKRQAGCTGLKYELHVETLERRLDPVLETECFRVAQEALTNVARHAKAHVVQVELRQAEGQLHLRVRDDGIGFDVAAVRNAAVQGKSLGVLSMEERASLAGGDLEFKSTPGHGAEVHAWFPLKWVEAGGSLDATTTPREKLTAAA